jgi:hypothetical protein
MIATEEKLKRFKIDCLYGKKKHFNAADRKDSYHYWIGIPLIVINILTATVLFFVFTEHGGSIWKFIPILFAFFASFLSGFQTYFNFNKQAEGHRKIANRYLALMKKAERLQGYIADNAISDSEIVAKFEALSVEADAINKDAEQYPTSAADYSKAQKGLNAGDEGYTQHELEL